MGTWDWGTFFSGVGLVVVGATAVADAGTVLACSGTDIVMGLVASYTLVAGGLTAINGVAERIEAGTDFNFVRDIVFLGSEELYEGVKNLLKTQAEIGTMICGAYITVNGGMVCFVAGTLVSTEEGQIRIEDIEPGMLVWATDPITGETALKPVVQTFVNQTNELVHVTVNGETITCTNEHPFYSPVKGWIAACQLRAGDILVMLNGERIVVEQVQHELLESPVTVYNFEVADYHTYFVGKNSILVHNQCKVDGSGHGSDIHTQRIDEMINNLKNSGNYTEIYGNRALKTAGLNGTQRPDIIAKRIDGTYEIWEFASISQATGTRGYSLLDAKIKLMHHNNPSAIFHPIIPWS